jgi:hypothetical protein
MKARKKNTNKRKKYSYMYEFDSFLWSIQEIDSYLDMLSMY